MADDPGPMVRRRQLGSALRGYRVQADLTVAEVAERLMVAASKISRIETAQRNATIRDVRDLCDIYEITDPEIREQLMDLARGSRQRAWWQDTSIPPALQRLIGMEGSATVIKEFETLSLPGLLQTEAYAIAVTSQFLAGDPVRLKSVVEARMRRQQIFAQKSPPKADMILDEAALRRIVGGAEVMHEQVDHLINAAKSESVVLRVIPFSVGGHIGMNGGFTILEFGTFIKPVVYVETLDGHMYYEQSTDLEKYHAAFDSLSGQAADIESSVGLLIELRHFFAKGRASRTA